MPPVAESTNAAVQGQIDLLGETMRTGFGEIKGMLRGMDERMRTIERTEAGCFPLTSQRMEAFGKQVDALEETVKDHGELLAELVSTNRTLKWIAGIITTILVAVLIALATGNATIVFH